MKRDCVDRPHHTIPSLLLGILLSFPLVLGCSSLGAKDPGQTQQHLGLRTEIEIIHPDVSLESLENDPTFLADHSPEIKAAELSRLWLEHGLYLERSSYTGAFAAFSRAAHIASEALISESCLSFQPTRCRNLNQNYKRSLAAITKLLAQNSWRPPSLERTRYRLSDASIQTIRSLSAWKFDPDYLSNDSSSIRPGLGLPLVGCRPIRGNDAACSPLTLVITFTTQQYTDSIEATISAYDAFQQEMLSIGNTQIPLAGNLEQSAFILGKLASQGKISALYCLSLPTPHTATSVFFVEASQTPLAVQNLIVPLLRDTTIINATSICIQTIGIHADTSLSPHTVLTSLRSAHSLSQSPNIAIRADQPLIVVSLGQRASEYALKLPKAMSHFRTSRGRRRTPEAPFSLRSMVVIGADKTSLPTFGLATSVPARYYAAPCDTACIAGIKSATLENAASIHLSDQVDPDSSLAEEDLPLSPVI